MSNLISFPSPASFRTIDHAPAPAAPAPAMPASAADASRAAAVPPVGMPTHAVALGRAVGSLRHNYRLVRLKGPHAALQDAAWLDQLDTMASELLLQAREGGDVKWLADLQNVDPFKRYLFLLEAEALAARENETDPEVRRRLAHAMTEIWDEHQREIQAGFHTAWPFASFVQYGREWDELRQIYFNWIVHGGTLAATFKSLLQKFGARRMRDAVDALRKALAADLASTNVNADWTRMVQQQCDLENNRTIWSLLTDANQFLGELSGTPAAEQQVTDFVAEVLEYAAGPASERRLNALCALALPASEITEALRWRVRTFMKRKLAMSLWHNAEARDTLFPPMFAPRSR